MRLALSAIVFVLLSGVSARLFAQELIIHQKIVRLRHLTGTVIDSTGVSIPYATIELRDSKDHHVLVSNFADANGKFSFADRKRGEQVEIRVSRAGFNIVQYSIVVVRFGKQHLQITLPIGA